MCWCAATIKRRDQSNFGDELANTSASERARANEQMSERERAMGADREREQDGARGTWGSKVLSIIKITSRVCEGWSFFLLLLLWGKGSKEGTVLLEREDGGAHQSGMTLCECSGTERRAKEWIKRSLMMGSEQRERTSADEERPVN